MNHKTEKFIIKGKNTLKGTVRVSGAKNAALKALVAACLTDEKVIIKNIPLISDFFVMVEIMKDLGADVTITDHEAHVHVKQFSSSSISLDKAAHARTSAMFIAPLLVRTGEAVIPNPGGCRLGARPIDRIVQGIELMNVDIKYHSEDGYFHAKSKGLKAIEYTFAKNTHTGTETLIMAAVLAEGTTVLKNAAEEPEIDDLIDLLNAMGADVKRSGHREITIVGAKRLHGAEFSIKPDRNEIVTFAIAALVTGGDVFIEDADSVDLEAFFEKLDAAGAGYEHINGGIRFFTKGALKAVDIETAIYPGFMTDWQAPWAVLMTQATGEAIIHETVFENKLKYIKDLQKMGAKAHLYNPKVENPEKTYNFNLNDDDPEFFHAVKIFGPVVLHDAVLTMHDIRAGAAVVLAALAAQGESVIHGVPLVRRGYENFEGRLQSLGADIKVQTE
jgi:UDP-N-acetylglucosamine 1-carboxyvinyltransferase